MPKRIGRTLFVLFVALSVITLPAAIGFAANGKTTEAAASEIMPDCDHHHNAPSDQTHKTMDDSACMANCALTSFGFTATGVSGIAFSLSTGTALKPVLTDAHVASRMGTPPFRPPRA